MKKKRALVLSLKNLRKDNEVEGHSLKNLNTLTPLVLRPLGFQYVTVYLYTYNFPYEQL